MVSSQDENSFIPGKNNSCHLKVFLCLSGMKSIFCLRRFFLFQLVKFCPCDDDVKLNIPLLACWFIRELLPLAERLTRKFQVATKASLLLG